MNESERVLAGTRVLDFGRYIAGPYCATLLGYLGADVIRIEKPTGGEDRFIAPVAPTGEGGVFFQAACNKRSLALKINSDAGKKIISQLVAGADVLVANLPPDSLAALGLDYASLSNINPRIILASQSAFGETGPLAKRGGFDGVAQAMSGAAYITGTPGAPIKAAAPYADFSTAVLSAFGVLAALMERERSGRGQQVGATLLHSAMAVFGSHLIEQAALGIDRVGTGNRVQTSAPSDVFATRDGHVLIHVVGQGLFKRCATLVGEPQWADDPNLQSDQARGDRREILCEKMSAWCAARTNQEALDELVSAGIPAGPVLTPREALAQEQVAAMEYMRDVEFPGLDSAVPVPDLPLKFSRMEAGIAGRPPRLGEHTREILTELGYAAGEIDKLSNRGIVRLV